MNGQRHDPRSVRFRGIAPVTHDELRSLFDWNGFPRKMRRHFLAQNGLCPYCGRPIPLGPSCARSANDAKSHSWDHVVPRASGGSHADRNNVVAHRACNAAKSDRSPYPCELIFLAATYAIALALTPHGGEPNR